MNWLSLVLQALSSLPGIISGVEAAKPTTPGAGKKLTVLDQVATAMSAADPIYGPLIASHPAVQAAVSAATDAIVDVFNKSAAIAATVVTTPPATIPPAPTAPATIPAASVKTSDGMP